MKDKDLKKEKKILILAYVGKAKYMNLEKQYCNIFKKRMDFIKI